MSVSGCTFTNTCDIYLFLKPVMNIIILLNITKKIIKMIDCQINNLASNYVQRIDRTGGRTYTRRNLKLNREGKMGCYSSVQK